MYTVVGHLHTYTHASIHRLRAEGVRRGRTESDDTVPGVSTLHY